MNHQKEKLIGLLNELRDTVSMQPHWGGLAIAKGAVAGWAINSSTKSVKQQFDHINAEIEILLETDKKFETNEHLADFKKGTVYHDFMCQKYKKVKKSINELLNDLQ